MFSSTFVNIVAPIILFFENGNNFLIRAFKKMQIPRIWYIRKDFINLYLQMNPNETYGNENFIFSQHIIS